MTTDQIKANIWPALIGAAISFIGSAFMHQISTVREIGEVAGDVKEIKAVVKMYIPAIEKRVEGIDNKANLNDKRITANEIALAKMP